MTMAGPRSRKAPAPPDGQPAPGPAGTPGATADVSQVDDPLIAGDAEKGKRVEADESPVDDARQIARDPKQVDLLH